MMQNYLIRFQQISIHMDGEKRNLKKMSWYRGRISIYLIPSPAALELKMLLY